MIEQSASKMAQLLAGVIEDHKGQDVKILDVSALVDWTDCFVIATAHSIQHMIGLESFIHEAAFKSGYHLPKRSRHTSEDQWLLIDLGHIIVHIFTQEARNFYDLERLWFQAVEIKK